MSHSVTCADLALKTKNSSFMLKIKEFLNNSDKEQKFLNCVAKFK